ncbi:MAG TPA: HNH endonuclease signature motif containing protein [Stellaceae bacterium]|nr:HNH endonuclease signature motif containing protein [Stellaceae bacterium]
MPTLSEALAAVEEQHAPPLERHRDRARRFYQSQSWRRLRFKALAANAARHSDGAPHCELCHRSSRDGVILDVDHVLPLSAEGGWARRLDPSNVQILCRDDNFGKGNRSTVDYRPPAGDAEREPRHDSNSAAMRHSGTAAASPAALAAAPPAADAWPALFICNGNH